MIVYITYNTENNQLLKISSNFFEGAINVVVDDKDANHLLKIFNDCYDGWYYKDEKLFYDPVIYFIVNNNNTIEGISYFGTEKFAIQTQYTLKTFEQNFNNINLTNGKYKYINNEVVYIEENPLSSSVLQQLRSMRQSECFSIINRGQLWYSLLNDSQLKELKTWYQAWLDATETGVIPEKPSWLGDK